MIRSLIVYQNNSFGSLIDSFVRFVHSINSFTRLIGSFVRFIDSFAFPLFCWHKDRATIRAVQVVYGF